MTRFLDEGTGPALNFLRANPQITRLEIAQAKSQTQLEGYILSLLQSSFKRLTSLTLDCLFDTLSDIAWDLLSQLDTLRCLQVGLTTQDISSARRDPSYWIPAHDEIILSLYKLTSLGYLSFVGDNMYPFGSPSYAPVDEADRRILDDNRVEAERDRQERRYQQINRAFYADCVDRRKYGKSPSDM